MTETTSYTAGLYCRLSKEDKLISSESMSIDTQKKKLTDFAYAHGISIGGIYCDDGITGVTFDRPAFEKMMSHVNNGKLNCIITKDLSRLGRDDSKSNYYYEDVFLTEGIRFIAIDDNVDTIRGYENVVAFMNMFNAMYPRDISKKTRSALKTKAQHGEFLGSKAPFGYKKSTEDKHKLIIDDDAAEIVRHIFNMANEGIGKRKIAKLLYQEKVPTPSVYARDKGINWCFPFRDTYENDYIWSDMSVGEILKNEVYIGNMVHGKSKKASHKSKKIFKVPEEEWIRVENTHEPIIEKDIWDAVQQKISIRKRPTAEKTTQIFAGLLKCADCGRTMSYARKKDSDYAYFNCRTYRDKGTDFCTSHRINYKTVYSLVLTDIQRHTRTLKQSESKLYDAALSFNKEQCLRETKAWREQVKKIEKRIHELDFIIKKTYENNLTGKISDERFSILSSDYEKEQSELKEKQTELQNKLNEYVEHEENADKFVEMIRCYTDITELDAKTLNELIDRIEVGQKYKDEEGQQRQDLTIFYKFCGNINY